ncbi:MAG: GNAT family N-acetyltransferase [Verrucomicrobiota bacterium]
MSQVPPVPETLRFGGVILEFFQLSVGNPERGIVPAYHFQILDLNSNKVGHLSFRVGDTEHIKLAAGHIGYEITEEHRGHSYAYQACLAAAPWIATRRASLLITADPDNAASIRTIEKLGATFLNEVDVPENDPHHKRGSLRKRRYEWTPSL